MAAPVFFKGHSWVDTSRQSPYTLRNLPVASDRLRLAYITVLLISDGCGVDVEPGVGNGRDNSA